MLKYIIPLIIPIFTFAITPNFESYDGSAIIVDLNSSDTKHFGTFTDERLSPCSTFKILNSLIALDSHVIKDENEIIPWDGKVRQYDFWNKDHSMRSAISVSAVWFYQELARRIGQKRMQEMVSKVDYGNNDTSKTLIDFWLGEDSLKISLSEQVLFLSQLIRQDLPFSKRSMEIVKDIMQLDNTFFGKTGSCGGVGWFVGFVQEPQSTKVFAFAIKGKGANGVEAKRIALEYLKAE